MSEECALAGAKLIYYGQDSIRRNGSQFSFYATVSWSINMIVLLRFVLDVCNQYSGTEAHVTPIYGFHEAFQ